MYKQPTLTKQWKFLCKYYIVISDALVGFFLDVLFLLLAVILSELHVKRRRKDWVSEKIYRKICVRGIHFLTALPPFYVIFCCFLCLRPSPSQVTYLLNGLYGWCPVWWYHEWMVKNIKISCNLILAGCQP